MNLKVKLVIIFLVYFSRVESQKRDNYESSPFSKYDLFEIFKPEGKFQNESGKSESCPDQAITKPCECSANEKDLSLTLDCSKAFAEDDLRRVFGFENLQEMGFRTFSMLSIYQYSYNNISNLTTLSPGVFGNTNFEEIIIEYVSNLTVDPKAFSGMEEVVEKITISGSNLGEFVADFENFEKLHYLSIDANFMSLFEVHSPVVTHLNLGFNNLKEETFNTTLPNLKSLWLYNNKFQNVPQILSQYKNLTILNLKRNGISVLKEGQICHSDYMMFLDLSSNDIWKVEMNSICVHEGASVMLGSNNITSVDRQIFEPIVLAVKDQGLDLFDNPLLCGCDIAWLFTNDNYLSKIGKYTTCSNGEYLTSLNSSMFLDCQESPVISQGSPVISSDLPVISSDLSVISQGSPVIYSDLPVISQGSILISSVLPVISLESPVISQGSLVISSDLPGISQESPMISQGSPEISDDLPEISGDLPEISGDLLEIYSDLEGIDDIYSDQARK